MLANMPKKSIVLETYACSIPEGFNTLQSAADVSRLEVARNTHTNICCNIFTISYYKETKSTASLEPWRNAMLVLVQPCVSKDGRHCHPDSAAFTPTVLAYIS
jgi:hypothetical protein